jgi:predicted kinase
MKKVIVMQGIPGSGKSTDIKGQVWWMPSGGLAVVSADHYFVELGGGTYAFDPSKLPEAHGKCLRRFIEALQAGAEVVIVDNTNTTAVECAPYMAAAAAWGYEAEIRRIECDPEVAAARNTHGVPAAGVKAMAERLAAFQPMPWWKVTVA